MASPTHRIYRGSFLLNILLTSISTPAAAAGRMHRRNDLVGHKPEQQTYGIKPPYILVRSQKFDYCTTENDRNYKLRTPGQRYRTVE